MKVGVLAALTREAESLLGRPEPSRMSCSLRSGSGRLPTNRRRIVYIVTSPRCPPSSSFGPTSEYVYLGCCQRPLEGEEDAPWRAAHGAHLAAPWVSGYFA